MQRNKNKTQNQAINTNTIKSKLLDNKLQPQNTLNTTPHHYANQTANRPPKPPKSNHQSQPPKTQYQHAQQIIKSNQKQQPKTTDYKQPNRNTYKAIYKADSLTPQVTTKPEGNTKPINHLYPSKSHKSNQGVIRQQTQHHNQANQQALNATHNPNTKHNQTKPQPQ